MSHVLEIAQIVTEKLGEDNAELLYVPEFELRDLDKMRVVVVPCGTSYKIASRWLFEEFSKIQIGVMKRCNEDELNGMIEFVEELGRKFLCNTFGSGTCIAVEYKPLYSPEHLRERRQFTSVLELTFKMYMK